MQKEKIDILDKKDTAEMRSSYILLFSPLIGHPVVIPPCDELNDTYELESKKNPAECGRKKIECL